ncbi:hypothetical protein Bca52824_092321 [Brassica carinata]|uniref:Uncharacterized protein n=1 Tax=Brassica carinata TaxID=52824 RepID=A0A8X7TET0_BRACI|nr:hypothetical protein Bca52824_092321 [Brassica carinata]
MFSRHRLDLARSDSKVRGGWLRSQLWISSGCSGSGGDSLLAVLLAEKTHSAINKGGENWTDSYWDEFASLPPIVPDGPIAIYGLGGGTAARLILELYPSTQLEGWEIDDIDEFASLPPIVPDGPIAIYGLGGGTAARLILELYPSTQLEGWEIDDIV